MQIETSRVHENTKIDNDQAIGVLVPSAAQCGVRVLTMMNSRVA